jgi:hypothetical protein
VEEIPMPGLNLWEGAQADLAATPLDLATELWAENSLASLAEPQLDQEQEVAWSVTDLTVHHTPDIAIEDVIDRLADDLAAFCFEHLEEDVNLSNKNNVIDVHIDQEAFEEELRVRDLKW